LLDVYERAGIKTVVVTMPEKINDNHIPNAFPEEGLLGSIKTAIKLLPSDIDGLFINPVDAPCTSPDLVRALGSLFDGTPKIAIARHKEKLGHPVAFSKHFFAELLDLHPKSGGARCVIKKHANCVRTTDSDDPRILCNINTKNDYFALNSLLFKGGTGRISPLEKTET
jgi:CTP:molybdopterin cytidylyltransferase MocA